MKKQLLALLLGFSLMQTHAQNLVPNSSFETQNSCPSNNIFTAANWFNPNTASPDYFHPCGSGWTVPPAVLFGPQSARTGSCFAGAGWYNLAGGWYDYIQVQLTASMTPATIYSVSMWVCMANGVKKGSDDIGIYISNGTFKSSPSMTVVTNSTVATTPSGFGVFTTFTPQIKCPDGNFITDTLNWTLVSGTYTATGGENAVTIGCFEPWATTGTVLAYPAAANDRCYYYIDDVSVEAIAAPNQPGTISGTTINCGAFTQSYSVAAVPGATAYSWNLPMGWTGTSTTNVISVTTNSASGTLSVAAINLVGPSPVQTLSVTINNVLASLTQTATVLYSGLANNYQWVDCNNNYSVIASGTNSFAPSQSGSYAVIVTQNGCIDTSDCQAVTIITTSLDEHTLQKGFGLFPNPASETFTLKAGLEKDDQVVIYNCIGTIVYREIVEKEILNKDIKISDLPAGIYFVQLSSQNRTLEKKRLVILR